MHEICHAMGLYHLYELTCCPETCDENDLDYLDDAFNSGASKICHRPAGASFCNDPFLSDNDECTNNVLGGPTAYYLTPKQIGRIHRNAYFLGCRGFVYNTFPEDDNHSHTGEGQTIPLEVSSDETWDFDIKMYNDIIVKSGATLTIKCRVLMPYLSNLIVAKGAALVIDGGTITA